MRRSALMSNTFYSTPAPTWNAPAIGEFALQLRLPGYEIRMDFSFFANLPG
jgi:hypothetical protein